MKKHYPSYSGERTHYIPYSGEVLSESALSAAKTDWKQAELDGISVI